MGGFSSVVALQLHKLETRFNSCSPHKPLGLVAYSYNPASGRQGYLDGTGHLGLKTWLGLDLLVSLLGLET